MSTCSPLDIAPPSPPLLPHIPEADTACVSRTARANSFRARHVQAAEPNRAGHLFLSYAAIISRLEPGFRLALPGATEYVVWKNWTYHPLGDTLIIMRLRHADRKLQRLEVDLSYTAGLNAQAIRGFRKVMGWIRSAEDERDFYALKGLHYEKLKGSRSHQRSMRLNNQFRLVLELQDSSEGKVIVVVSIEDYH